MTLTIVHSRDKTVHVKNEDGSPAVFTVGIGECWYQRARGMNMDIMPPHYPMPVVKPNYIMSHWNDRAAYSVWLWSLSEQDIENGIWYHAMMDNREAGLI